MRRFFKLLLLLLLFFASEAQAAYIYNPYTGKLDYYQSASLAIGSAITSGASGSILFIDSSGNLAQDNANLFYDDTNNRVGIGTNSLFGAKANILIASATELGQVIRAATSQSGNLFEAQDSSGNIIYKILSNGRVKIGNGDGSQNGAIDLTITNDSEFGNTILGLIDSVNNVEMQLFAGSGIAYLGSATNSSFQIRANANVAAIFGKAINAVFGNSNIPSFSVGNQEAIGMFDISRDFSGTPHAVFGPYASIMLGTFTDDTVATSGTRGVMFFNVMGAPTLAASNTGVTTTDVYTFSFKGAPKAGTNQTLTNSTAVNIESVAVNSVGSVGTSYGLQVNEMTGATTNYAAYFRGKTLVKQGLSTAFAKVGGTIFDHFADVGNVGTGEDDLYSDTIPASSFGVNGDKVTATFQGVFVGAAASTQELRGYLGGTKIYDSGALAIGVATNNWTVYVTCIRVSSSVVRCGVSLSTDFGTLFPYSTYTEVTGLTLTNTQILKLTGEAAGVGAANDQIIAKLGYVEWRSAA